MSLSLPDYRKSPTQSPQQTRDRTAVIENDWVPAIQLSEMNHADPVRLAGPLRPTWYLGGVKSLLFRVVRAKRQTV